MTQSLNMSRPNRLTHSVECVRNRPFSHHMTEHNRRVTNLELTSTRSKQHFSDPMSILALALRSRVTLLYHQSSFCQSVFLRYEMRCVDLSLFVYISMCRWPPFASSANLTCDPRIWTSSSLLTNKYYFEINSFYYTNHYWISCQQRSSRQIVVFLWRI